GAGVCGAARPRRRAFSCWKWRSIGLVASPGSGSGATSEEPPSNRAWPTPAGRLTRVTSLCRAGWLHLVERAKLALGGLRSAEPRLGEPGPPLGRAGEDRLGAAGGRRRSPSRLERRRAHLRERLGDRLGARRALLDERREAGLEAVAVGIDRPPPVAEPLGVVAAEVRAHVGALEQQRSLGQQQADRVLDRVDVADEVVLGDEVEY